MLLLTTVFATGFATLASALSLPATKITPTQAPASDSKLVPIVGHSDHSFGKRSTALNFTSLEPSTQAQMLYGNPNTTAMLANLTLFADDGQLLVMMEEFEGLTSSVDCNDADGFLQLIFASQKAYDYAIQKWSYINENAHTSFLMITNHQGCGNNNERAPYNITAVDDDSATLTVKLTAAPAEWQDVAKTFTLDFGHVPAEKLNRRCNPFDCEEDPASSIPISLGTENQAVSILNDDTLNLVCSNCFVSGSIEVAAHIEVETFSVKQFSLTMSPQSLRAALEVNATMNAGKEYSPAQYPLIQPIPFGDAGLSIPKILQFGLFGELDVGATVKADADFSLTAGFTANIPDSALVTLDLVNLADTGATGWDQTSVQPNFDISHANATISGTVFLAPKISLMLNVLDNKVANISAGLEVHLPQIDLSASVAYNENGNTCSGSDTDYGVDLKAGAEIDLDLDLDCSVIELIHTATQMSLMATTLAAVETCIGFGPTHVATTNVQATPTGNASVSTQMAGSLTSLPASSAPIATGAAVSGTAQSTGIVGTGNPIKARTQRYRAATHTPVPRLD